MTGTHEPITYAEYEALYEAARIQCEWDRGYCYDCAAGGTCPKSLVPPFSSVVDPPPRGIVAFPEDL